MLLLIYPPCLYQGWNVEICQAEIAVVYSYVAISSKSRTNLKNAHSGHALPWACHWICFEVARHDIGSHFARYNRNKADHTISEQKYSQTLEFDDNKLTNLLLGPQGANLDLIAEKTATQLASRGNSVHISSAEPAAVEFAAKLLHQLYAVLRGGFPLDKRDISRAIGMLEDDPALDLRRFFKDSSFVASPRRNISPKSLNQRDYLNALKEEDMVFGIGPAGTGKTYLAVAMAVSFLLSKKVKRIILTRPAVEAGEKLGFLPGDMVEKVNPYLRPLYDALYDMLDFERVAEMMESGVIEIAPLAFMRGRTLNDAFIILDEAQNTTPEQMKMFLTRMGFGSRMAVTGDITQIDLPKNGVAPEFRSGLVQALTVLQGISGARVIRFEGKDVVRHPMVAKVVAAYERFEKKS